MTLADFQRAVTDTIARHPVVQHNPYTAWFAQGDISLDEPRHFAVQFSVLRRAL
jgi:hypothetical protein